MSEARREIWDLPGFLAWEAAQPERHEFVDGVPRLMTGGSQAHSLIGINLTATLRDALRGMPCRPGGSDLRVITGNGNARYPDALIDCGRFDPDAHEASEPVAVFEVLSPSTAWIDHYAKLHDYDATPSIALYAVLAQDRPHIALWRRDAAGRLVLTEAVTGRAAMLTLAPPIAVVLPLTDIYAGLADPA